MSEYADPNCPHCGGSGFIYGDSLLDGGHNCECMLDALRLENMERVWLSLSDAKDVPQLRENPPLLRLTKYNAWITGPIELFKRHLKAVAFHKHTLWDAKVRTDAMILDSWFGTLKAQGAKIYDVEIEKSILEAIDIRDLVEPPELCVFVLGTKRLPNKEAPNSILEAISYRKHVNKPTWVVDQPDHPIDRNHHLFYSETLEKWLNSWPHVSLAPTTAHVVGEPRIQHAVASASDIEDLLDDGESTGNADIDEALSDVGEMHDEEDYEEEDYEEEEETTNLLSTLKIESDEKSKYKKKKWGKRK